MSTSSLFREELAKIPTDVREQVLGEDFYDLILNLKKT